MSLPETERIAVIGAVRWSHEEPELQMDCVTWDTPFSTINLRDYDVWIMHVDSLPAVIPVGSILDSLSPGYLYGALINGLRVYVLGDPRLAV
jgi:hypothetical protein